MVANLERVAPACLHLWAETAADLMTGNPVSLRDNATIQEAVMLFTDRGVRAAPVIDEAGRPVGVLSHTDIVIHDRERVEHVPVRETVRAEDVATPEGERLGRGFHVEKVDRTRVRDLMTPALFAVAPNTPAAEVVEQMLALNVHRLFVVDRDGVLVGVISPFDILSRLRP